MSDLVPLYTNAAQVKSYIGNKANYDTQVPNGQPLTTAKINKFIIDAEVDVERELSKQYVTPFQTTDGQPFVNLPRTSLVIIQNICSYLAASKILRIYFGISEGVRGHDYAIELERLYRNSLKDIVTRDGNGNFTGTPLPGMALNANALYRTDAGIPAPMSVSIGGSTNNNINRTRRKLADLNKSIYFGPYIRKR